jgi:chaperonin cofactor prefoldin
MLFEKLTAKMEALNTEAQELSAHRDALVQRIREVEVRLTQIVGAMSEIKMVLDEEKPAEVAAE